jgi:hypothetical protein
MKRQQMAIERSFSSLCESRDAVRYPGKPKGIIFFFLFNRLFGMIPAPHTLFISLDRGLSRRDERRRKKSSRENKK